MQKNYRKHGKTASCFLAVKIRLIRRFCSIMFGEIGFKKVKVAFVILGIYFIVCLL
jgi:hypothetical protein